MEAHHRQRDDSPLSRLPCPHENILLTWEASVDLHPSARIGPFLFRPSTGIQEGEGADQHCLKPGQEVRLCLSERILGAIVGNLARRTVCSQHFLQLDVGSMEMVKRKSKSSSWKKVDDLTWQRLPFLDLLGKNAIVRVTMDLIGG